MSRCSVVAATANAHKLVEMRELLGQEIDLLARPQGIADVVEDAPTLEGNARLKAWAVAGPTQRPALADDTGLEVEALDLAPGVRSARFAGENATDAQNRALLLSRLGRASYRRARFRTVLVLVVPWPCEAAAIDCDRHRDPDSADAAGGGDRQEIVVEGRCEGRIGWEEKGEGGFGYDSIFIPDGGGGRTFAEMSAGEKNQYSHRAFACAALRPEIARVCWGIPRLGRPTQERVT